MDKLLAALRDLPPSQHPTTEANLLILTFCVDGNCTTRVYDRASPPPEARKIYQLTGAPLKSSG